MVLVEGQNGDGATVDEDDFPVGAAGGSETSSAADRVLAAILGTRESAAEGDFQLTSTGVTWTDPLEAAALRDALAAHKVENVMLVSAFLVAAALAQAAGSAVGYARTGLLFLEPDTATLAVVDSADGSIVDVRRQPMRGADASVELADFVAWLNALESAPDGLFVVGSGVDIAPIKPRLETATALPVSCPEEPETALARGAALASASAPLFASSTAALAYAQVPDWTTAGVVDPYAVAPDTVGADSGDEARGYGHPADLPIDDMGHGRTPFLVALGVMAIFFVGVFALVISLAVSVRPTASQRPKATGNLIFPVKQVPAPGANAAVKAPSPAPPVQIPQVAPEAQQAPPAVAPAPEPPPARAVPAPAPAPAVVVPAPAAPTPAVVAPPPEAPAPEAPGPIAAAPVPTPAPEAPAPAPAPVAPAPVPVPLPVVVPGLPILPIFNPPIPQSPSYPGGGERGGGGWPGGGEGGWPGGGGHGGFGGFGGDHGGFGGGFGGHGGGHH
jgi:uncharacterized membrane protein YgcG